MSKNNVLKKQTKAENFTFKKVVYKDKWTAESFPITKKPDIREFHTIAIYETDEKGHEHFVIELEVETFKQVVRDFVIIQIKNS